MKEEQRTERPAALKKSLAGVYAFTATISANNMTSALLAYIMVTYADEPGTNISMIVTIPAIVGTFFAFVSGTVLNKVGLKRFTLSVQLLQFLYGMIFLFLGSRTGVPVLWAAAVLYGFMYGSQQVIQGEWYRRLIPDEGKRAPFIGYGNSVMSLGSVLFTAIGGAIAALDNGAHWERAFFLYFAIAVCMAAEVFLLPPDGKGEPLADAVKEKKKTSSGPVPLKVWAIAIHFGLFYMCLYTFSLNISEYVITTHALGSSVESGMALSFITVGGVISGMIFGRYLKLWKQYTMTVLLAICCVGLALCVWVPNIPILYAASFLIGFSMLGCGPFVLTKLSEVAKGEQYAKAVSVYSGCMNAGMMVTIYVLAFFTRLLTGDASNVDGKFFVAFAGTLLVCLLSIPIYGGMKGGEDARKG